MPEPTPTRGPYPPGRQCTHPGCITVLSTHHESPTQKCYTHESRHMMHWNERDAEEAAHDLQELIEA